MSFARLTQPIDPVGIQKEISVWLSPNDAHVRVTHRLRNGKSEGIELAPWALSVMAPGGTAILPLPLRGEHPEHLLPTFTISLWPYTDLTDRRWTLGKRYIMLRQDSDAARPQKIGAMVPDGWAAYARAGYALFAGLDLTGDAQALRETARVMRGMGINPQNLPGVPVALLGRAIFLPAWITRPILRNVVSKGRGDKLPSFHYDIGKGRSEVDWINGAVVREGSHCNFPTPANHTLTQTLLRLVRNRVAWDDYHDKPEELLKVAKAAGVPGVSSTI